MLEKIKELLGLDSDNQEKDEIIMLYICMLEGTILDITGLKELNRALRSFIVSKVCAIMNSKGIGDLPTQNTGEISSITRGDTTITYNKSSSSTSSSIANSSSIGLTEEELSFVKQFRKLRYF